VINRGGAKMDIRLQAVLGMSYIVIPQMILCIYLINRYGRVLGYDMGPKLGEVFILDKFLTSNVINSKSISELREYKKLLFFVSMTCPSCKEILNHVNENFEDHFDNICVIVSGNRTDVEKWYVDNKYKFSVNYIEEDILTEEIKIYRFPYSFVLEHSMVIKKGPLFLPWIEDYIAKVN